MTFLWNDKRYMCPRLWKSWKATTCTFFWETWKFLINLLNHVKIYWKWKFFPIKWKFLQAGRVPKMKHEQVRESDGIGPNLRSIVIVVMLLLLMLFAVHCTWVTSNAYSSPSIVLASYSNDGSRQILDDFREAYYWLSQNTADDARIMSW